MNFKKLGNTNLKVSTICLGTMTWCEQNTQKEAFEQMNYSLDCGINFFDAAEIYPSPCRKETYGETERIIGSWFNEKKNRDKIILATNKIEQEKLSELKIRGEQNGLIGLQIIGKDKIKDIEPFSEGVAALFVPESGIIDYKAVTNKLSELIVQINPNSKIQTSCEVLDVNDEVLLTNQGNIQSHHSVFCGGLFSDRLAKKDDMKLKMKIVGFRGDYYDLEDHAKEKVNNLIYPVPNPEFPFLGVHFTRMTDGSTECGPNAVFTF